MFRNRFFVSIALVALLSVLLAGCGLKPGSNDSSSTPPTVLNTPSSTTFTGNGPNVVFKTANVTFSHDQHVTTFKRTCTECHVRNGVASDPWPMAYADVKYTMAQMYTGKGCGVCHIASGTASGTAFNINNPDNCVRCHTDSHGKVSTSEIGTDACKSCHAAIITEYKQYNTPSNAAASGTSHSSFFFDPAGGHAPTAANQYSCSECHAHESVFGKAAAMAIPTNLQHTITCQTCHYPTKADGGTQYPYRLRKSADQLCITCHHMRYTYGDNPPTSTSNAAWTVLPINDAGFPKLVPVTTGNATVTNAVSMPIEIRKWALNAKAIMSTASGQANAGYPIANLISRGQLGGTVAAPTGGNYPHDSTQYDLFMGKLSGTTIQFTNDLKGTTLAYNDSMPTTVSKACVTCHMQRDPVKGTFGHTFKGTEEGFAKVFPGLSMTQTETDVAALMATLKTMLDVDKDGIVNWTRSGVDGDLRAALGASKGLTPAAKLIMLGVAWNYFTVEGDSSEGCHNPAYVKSLLTNSITIMNQLKDATVSSDSAKITWY